LARVRIDRPLLKLPLRFCGDALAREVTALPASAWQEHPQKRDGNIAVPLVSAGGTINDDFSGPMGPTPWLAQCPYIMEVMQAFDATLGRSRLMGLRSGATVPEHVDIHYYWRTHLRIHIPVITNPEVSFTCANETVHMQAGESWILDSFYRHNVRNGGPDTRIHLVIDTVGSDRLWDLIEEALSGTAEEKLVVPGTSPARTMDYEQINVPLVMSPWEMQCHLAYISDWTDEQPGRDEVLAIVDRFVMAWNGAWARYGLSEEGLPTYAKLLTDVRTGLAGYTGPRPTLRNTSPLIETIARFILANAVLPAVLQQMQTRSAQASSPRVTA